MRCEHEPNLTSEATGEAEGVVNWFCLFLAPWKNVKEQNGLGTFFKAPRPPQVNRTGTCEAVPQRQGQGRGTGAVGSYTGVR